MQKKTKIFSPQNDLFMAVILLISGSMNSYSLNIYGSVAGAHTGDLTKMSSHLVNGKWDSALNNALMIAFCIVGVLLTEILKHQLKTKGDWRKFALILVAFGLFGLSFASDEAPKQLMSCVCSLLCGSMLNLFRDCEEGSVNSTIQTGNMRTFSQFLYEAADKNCNGTWKKCFKFLGLILSYAAGAMLMTLLCNIFQQKAALFSAFACIGMSLIVKQIEKSQK